MANKLILKRSSVAGKSPLATDLEVGELAVNLADRLLFSKDSGGNVIQVGGAGGGSNPNVVNLTGNGSTTAFSLGASPPSTNATSVYVNGVYQLKNTYSISGSTLTFSEAPPSGTLIEVVWGDTLDINVPTDGSVTEAKLASGSVTQAKFAANVAGNGPTFRATKGSVGNQTIGSNVWTKITFPNEDWDTNSNYDTGASRFTPTVAGYYFVRVSVAVTVASGTQFSLYRNGVFYTGALGADWIEIATIVYLNGSTDYIEGYIWNNTGVSVYQSATLTTFQAAMMRAG